MIRFLILFLVIIVTLTFVQLLKPVEQHVIEPFSGVLADVSTAIITAFDDEVASEGKIIRSTENGFAVSIERGCNGVEAVLILFAAIFAFPAPLKHKLAGFALGFVAIQGLNLVRIISLFYLGQWSMTWFKWFHLYLWQALIILDALVVWLIWLRYLPKPGGGDEPPADAGDDSSDLDLDGLADAV